MYGLIFFTLCITTALVISRLQYRQLYLRSLEDTNTILFLRANNESAEQELANAVTDLIALNNELDGYREVVPIHEHDPSLFVEDVDATDPTTDEYWELEKDEVADAIINAMDTNIDSTRFDSIKWTVSTDGNSAAAYGDDYEDFTDEA